jgi:hypothetical protein
LELFDKMEKEKVYVGLLVLVILLSVFSMVIVSSIDSGVSQERVYEEDSQAGNLNLVILKNSEKEADETS